MLPQEYQCKDFTYTTPALRFSPRVVDDQKAKFQSDELFKRLSRDSEVKYTGFRERPIEERRTRFRNGCREGHTEVAFVNTGTNLQLVFSPCVDGYRDHCDFDSESGKVHVKSSFIMNGVCVRWCGWLDLNKLDGVGCLEFDEQMAKVEDAMNRDQDEKWKQKRKLFESKHPPFIASMMYQGSTMEDSPRSTGSASN